ASDPQRATETAWTSSTALRIGPVTMAERLRERDAGEWSGLTRADIEAGWPGWLDSVSDKHTAFASGEGARRPPGWEPDASVLARALGALRSINEIVGDGDALAVTHGGLIYTVEHHLAAEVTRLA